MLFGLLREQVEHMRQRCDSELSQPKLRLPQRKALTSLQNHWTGLTVFVDHPEVYWFSLNWKIAAFELATKG